MIKKIKKIFVTIFILTFVFVTGCNKNETNVNSGTNMYKTINEWKEIYKVPQYVENKEIIGEYNESLAVKCKNGTFVGTMEDTVKMWKGIPYAKQPVGDLRWEKAMDAEPSEKVFEAKYFGKSCCQIVDDNEKASKYMQGDDCLTLNIWNNTKNNSDNKPVLVYIHGGGLVNGGSADPMYNGYYFSEYNEDVILVTINYRVGLMGDINLNGLSDGEHYEHNNFLLDQIMALKWINENISNFGGDKNNVTIAGESCGGQSVSLLAINDEATKYFDKVWSMSSCISFATKEEEAKDLTNLMCEHFNVDSVSELKKIPFKDIFDFWSTKGILLANTPIISGRAVPKDPFNTWRSGKTKKLTIMHSHTGNEFGYYKLVFFNQLEFWKKYCKTMVDIANEKGNDEYKKTFEEYKNELLNLGFKEDEIESEYMNDFYFAAGTYYQAMGHANAGGKEYYAVFDVPYDYPDYVGAGHAIDCYYLFGVFDGNEVKGTKEEVDLSRKYQKSITNFCINKNPSFDDIEWKAFEPNDQNVMIFSKDSHVEKYKYTKRMELFSKMMDLNEATRWTRQTSNYFIPTLERYPEVMGEMKDKISLPNN